MMSRSVGTATVCGVTTFAVYLIGAGRNLDYDSSETVGTFVATHSLLDPFRRQKVFNNHPLFSFFDHLVYSAGGHSAFALRVLPIAFASIAVGLVAACAARWWGALAGMTAGVLLAANPTFASYARSVRGYSLVTLCVVASTLLLVRLLRRADTWTSVGYGVVTAVGIGTHLYALLPLAAHVAAITSTRAFDRRWAIRFIAALTLGGFVYIDIGTRMLRSAGREAHSFRSDFPAELARSLLGTTTIAVALCSGLVLLGFVAVRRRETVAAAVALAVAVCGLWLVLQPHDLYPRFLVWLVAGIAVIAGAAVSRWRAAVALAIAAVAAMVVADARVWTRDPIPNRQAAELVVDVRERGERACVLPWIRGGLLAYTQAPREATRPRNVRRCDLVIGTLADSRALRRAARRALPIAWLLPAQTPYVVYSRIPRADL